MTWIIFVLAIGAGVGLWMDFVPSERAEEIGRIVTWIFTCFLSVYVLLESLLRPTRKLLASSIPKRIFIFLIMPLLLAFMSWLTFVHSLPAIYTLALGVDYQTTGVFRKEHSRSDRFCDYRIKSPMLDRAMPDMLCISEEAFRSESTKKFRLIGKKSTWGEYYEKVISELNVPLVLRNKKGSQG